MTGQPIVVADWLIRQLAATGRPWTGQRLGSLMPDAGPLLSGARLLAARDRGEVEAVGVWLRWGIYRGAPVPIEVTLWCGTRPQQRRPVVIEFASGGENASGETKYRRITHRTQHGGWCPWSHCAVSARLHKQGVPEGDRRCPAGCPASTTEEVPADG